MKPEAAARMTVDWQHTFELSLSAALASQIRPGVLVEPEVRYMRSFHGLGLDSGIYLSSPPARSRVMMSAAPGCWHRHSSTNFPVPLSCGRGFLAMLAFVKETKFFRKQADKAQRMARSATDVEISLRYLNMAQAYRSQAKVLKAKKKAGKKQR
jgi:hypothetical protein